MKLLSLWEVLYKREDWRVEEWVLISQDAVCVDLTHHDATALPFNLLFCVCEINHLLYAFTLFSSVPALQTLRYGQERCLWFCQLGIWSYFLTFMRHSFESLVGILPCSHAIKDVWYFAVVPAWNSLLALQVTDFFYVSKLSAAKSENNAFHSMLPTLTHSDESYYRTGLWTTWVAPRVGSHTQLQGYKISFLFITFIFV